MPVLGELELGWRLRPQRDDRGHGVEREDDDGRADRPPAPRARGCRWRWRQRRHGADVARRRRAAGGDGRRLRGVVVPARGHARLRARRRRAAQPRRGPPRPPRHVRRLQGRQARGVRPPAAGTVAVAPADLAGDIGGRRRARAVRRRRPRGPRRLCASSTATARSGGTASASSPQDELRLRGAHNRQNARPPRRSRSRAAWRPTAVREGLATFAGVAHRLEEVAPATACSTSTTPRPPTSPPRSRASSRSRAACT